MSQHIIEVVEVGDVYPHPNGDLLELTDVWGWTCCVGKNDFKKGDKAVYIPPDYVCKTDRPEFAFLKRDGRDTQRITVRRFRGTLSQGLLIPLPESLSDRAVGANVMDELGIIRYEAPLANIAAEGAIGGPSGLYAPKFDVDSFQRYRECFTEGEPVVVTEKLHGASSRFVWNGTAEEGVLFVGSRTNWWRDDPTNIWWKALKKHPQIETWCRAHPNQILFGEVFGQVQTLRYGSGKGEVFFAAFAGLNGHEWIDYADLKESCDRFAVPMAPHVFSGPLVFSDVYAMAEQDSRWPGAKHCAEGVVVVPQKERFHDRIGRVCLKIVSNRYLESGK